MSPDSSSPPAAAPALDHLGRRLLVPAGLAVLALAILVLVSDGRLLLTELKSFDLAILVPVLALSLVNYSLRFLRWQLYLRKLDSAIDLPASLAVFLVGFVLSVTPGKAGEIGKAWMVRHLGGGPVRRTVAAIIAERATDLAGVLVLGGIGSLAFPGGWWIASLCFAAAVGLGVVLSWASLFHWLLDRLKRLPKIGGRLEALDEVYDRLRTLMSPGMQLQSILLATLAWAAEGYGFWMVVRAYDEGASVLLSLFNYAVSTLAGGLSMLPGGLLASEGALTALLNSQGLETAAAASATLVIRGATLWFAVLLGLAVVPYLVRRLRAGS